MYIEPPVDKQTEFRKVLEPRSPLKSAPRTFKKGVFGWFDPQVKHAEGEKVDAGSVVPIDGIERKWYDKHHPY